MADRAPPPVTLSLRHAAPVWFARRAGISERLALDPMTTPAEVRGVRPGDMEPRALRISPVPMEIPVLAFEGRLWRQVAVWGGGTSTVEATMEADLAALSGGAWRRGPLFPMVPGIHGDGTFTGDSPMPPRALERASLALHAEARAHVLRVAREDMVHDGRRFLIAMDLPLHLHTKDAITPIDYRTAGRQRWRPSFPHDRRDLAAAYAESLGGVPSHVKEVRENLAHLAAIQAGALAGIPSRDDNLRHLAGTAPFQVLAGMAFRIHPPAAEIAALKRAAALGAMGVPVAEPADLLSLLHRTSGLVASCGGSGAAIREARYMAREVKGYCASLLRDLAAAPLPDGDADGLSALAPW